MNSQQVTSISADRRSRHAKHDWEGFGKVVELASLALATSKGKVAGMATLEKRSGKYRVIFYFGGHRFSRSLRIKSEREAFASVARLDDNPGSFKD